MCHKNNNNNNSSISSNNNNNNSNSNNNNSNSNNNNNNSNGGLYRDEWEIPIVLVCLILLLCEELYYDYLSMRENLVHIFCIAPQSLSNVIKGNILTQACIYSVIVLYCISYLCKNNLLFLRKCIAIFCFKLLSVCQ